MRATRFSIACTFAAASLAVNVPRIQAGPTVIRDELLRDTAITPSLGRGYSIATNTYQSMCLIDVVSTTPSYNFDYTFRKLTENEIETGSLDSSTDGTLSSEGASKKGPVDIGSLTAEWKSTKKTNTSSTSEKIHILVTINIDVYYSSVDETKSKLSPAAVKILENKDVPGFFDSCGMYYVRSISRRAAVISLFSFTSKSDKTDSTFVDHLKSTIRGFRLPSATNKGLEKITAEASKDSTKTATSEEKVEDLQISTKAVGLGKSQSTELVAYDLETFQTTVQSAFKATMPDNVGMVTAIEVVPWIENTEFQSLNKLEQASVPVLDDKGVPVMDLTNVDKPVPKMKTVMQYEQKRTLNVNAEFLAEVDRAARAKLNIYYKAKMCRSQINMDWMTVDNRGKWQFRTVPTGRTSKVSVGDTWVGNNRQHGDEYWIQLKDLLVILSEENLTRVWMEYDSFMYGGTGEDYTDLDDDPVERAKMARTILMGTKADIGYPANLFPGAGKCVSELFTAGITVRSYRTLPACQRMEETFATVSGQRMDDYCMPRFTGRPPVAAKSLQ